MTSEKLVIEMDEEENKLPPTVTVHIHNTFYGVPPSDILQPRAGKRALSPDQSEDRRVSRKLNDNRRTRSDIEHGIPAAGFSALPPELIAAICEHCTTETQLSLRLVSRKAEASCTSLLFKRVHVSRSLEDLRRVSGSRLAESVDAIDFYPCLLPGWDEEMWTYMLSPMPQSPIHDQLINNVMSGRPKNWLPDPEHMPTFGQYETEWRLFDALSQEQATWRNDIKGIALKRHLLSLPNLNEATLWYARDPRKRLERSIWRPFHPNSMAAHLDALEEPTQGNEYRGACVAIFLEAIGFRHRHLLPGEKPVEKLVLHMENTCKLITMMGHVHEHSKLPDFTTTCVRYADIMKVFEALTSLDLRWPEDHEWAEEPIGNGLDTELEQILLWARNLKSLHLELGTAGGGWYEADSFVYSNPLLDLFSRPGPTYHQLRDLHISARLPADAFVDFLVSHSETLKTVSLSNCSSDNWDLVLRAIAKLRLVRVYFENLYELLHDIPDDGSVSWLIETPHPQFEHGSDAEGPLNDAMKAWFARGGEGALPEEWYRYSWLTCDDGDRLTDSANLSD